MYGVLTAYGVGRDALDQFSVGDQTAARLRREQAEGANCKIGW